MTVSLIRKLGVLSDGSLQELPKRPPLWTHREDVGTDLWNGNLRPCASGGCPAVFVLKTPALKTQLTKDWQFYLLAINDHMTPYEMATELHFRLAFCNMTGLGDDDKPRRDYLRGKDLNARELPRFDKDRTCSRSVMTGAVDGDYLLVVTLDGNRPPPLKPGRSYPQRVEDVKADDYLYAPRTHRWLFFAANTVVAQTGGGSRLNPFPRGKVYPWTGDGRLYTWFPHVAREAIRYPLSRLRKLGDTDPIPSPYRA